MEEIRIRGRAVSRGIAIGPARPMAGAEQAVAAAKIKKKAIPDEQQRFLQAVRHCAAWLRARIEESTGQRADILVTHLAMVEDPYLEQLVLRHIEEERDNAENALMRAVETIAGRLAALPDEVFRQRADDLYDEGRRLLRCLRQGDIAGEEMASGTGALVLARQIPPSSAALMDGETVWGLATEFGTATSHTAILARGLGIPAVVGAQGMMAGVREGDMVIIDGLRGEVVLRPGKKALQDAEDSRRHFLQQQKLLQKLAGLPAQTTDGHTVALLANIGLAGECEGALARGAEGVGLFRTEFLYMETGQPPGEERQYTAYTAAARRMQGRPLTVRTVDAGADKPLPGYVMPVEDNPALGLRGVRLSLADPQFFKIQLRAVLRTATLGNVRLMYPMVSQVEELDACDALLRECAQELQQEGLGPVAIPPQGIMIETPAAVWTAETLAEKAEFFSIGTNDLTQYILAVDRGNPNMQYLYNHCHPAVLWAISHVVQAAHAKGRRVAVCGEMAADPKAALLLVGLGVDELSMGADSILGVKQAIRGVSYKKAQALAQKALAAESATKVEALLQGEGLS